MVMQRLDGVTNMRLDAELLARAEQGCAGFRVYAWDGPWVSLGRFQSADRDLLDIDVPWVMRPTGGKAVLHGHDVTVGLAYPLSGLSGSHSRGVKTVYRWLVEPIIQALRKCGVAAELAERTPHSNTGSRTADCFAYSSANDVIDTASGRKVCGCALRLTRTAALVQASIPNGKPMMDPRSVIRGASFVEGVVWDPNGFENRLGEAVNSLAGCPTP